MPNTTHLPRVTAEDVRRFADTVEIRDARAFAAELQAFVYERVKAARLLTPMEAETTAQTLARKAVALRASKRWAPTETDIQRGRVVLLTTFNQPQNLPLAEFAKLANKSRQQIYKDIVARRLLSLNVGTSRSEAARLAARSGKTAADPNHTAEGRGYRPLDDLPCVVRTSRRLGRAFAGGRSDTWLDQRRGRDRIQCVERAGALKPDRP
ncbi:hypothetical protein CCAE64S_00580 [Castellaniella caeni]